MGRECCQEGSVFVAADSYVTACEQVTRWVLSPTRGEWERSVLIVIRGYRRRRKFPDNLI